MDVSSGSDNAGSLSWPSSAPIQVSVHLCDYGERLDLRHSQAMPVGGDGRMVCDTRHGVDCDTQVGA